MMTLDGVTLNEITFLRRFLFVVSIKFHLNPEMHAQRIIFVCICNGTNKQTCRLFVKLILHKHETLINGWQIFPTA